jgi:hypothetical protein
MGEIPNLTWPITLTTLLLNSNTDDDNLVIGKQKDGTQLTLGEYRERSKEGLYEAAKKDAEQKAAKAAAEAAAKAAKEAAKKAGKEDDASEDEVNKAAAEAAAAAAAAAGNEFEDKYLGEISEIQFDELYPFVKELDFGSGSFEKEEKPKKNSLITGGDDTIRKTKLEGGEVPIGKNKEGKVVTVKLNDAEGQVPVFALDIDMETKLSAASVYDYVKDYLVKDEYAYVFPIGNADAHLIKFKKTTENGDLEFKRGNIPDWQNVTGGDAATTQAPGGDAATTQAPGCESYLGTFIGDDKTPSLVFFGGSFQFGTCQTFFGNKVSDKGKSNYTLKNLSENFLTKPKGELNKLFVKALIGEKIGVEIKNTKNETKKRIIQSNRDDKKPVSLDAISVCCHASEKPYPSFDDIPKGWTQNTQGVWVKGVKGVVGGARKNKKRRSRLGQRQQKNRRSRRGSRSRSRSRSRSPNRNRSARRNKSRKTRRNQRRR